MVNPLTPKPSQNPSPDSSSEQEREDSVNSEETPNPLEKTSVVQIRASKGEKKKQIGSVKNFSQAPPDLKDFRILEKLGEGAMGAVFKAQQLSFERVVALKVLFPHIAQNPKLVERLYREGRVSGTLDHANIVQAYEVGEDQGWHYTVLEYVDGTSLQKWLGKLKTIPLPDAVKIVIDVAKGLEYAHTMGIVHRDIKPDNILITRKGQVKVADLGMVKIDDDDMSLTQTGHAVGTPWYMPLEQAKNAKETDGRSDIYALGCMFYCMLTGQPPFVSRSLLEVIQAKELGTFPPARQLNSEVPERIDLMIAKMAHKLPKYRYQNCSELIQDLEDLKLASPQLSFVQKRITKLDGPSSSPTLMGKTIEKPGGDPNLWYLRTKGADGNYQVRKLTTDQIVMMLEDGRIDPSAKVSHTKEGSFRALGSFREFEGKAFNKSSQKKTEHNNNKYQSLFKKIEEKEKNREIEEEKSRNLPDGSDWEYYKPAVLKVAGISGAVILGYVILYWLIGLGR